MKPSLSTDSAQTANPGNTFVAFGDRPAEMMKIHNDTGTTIEYRVNASAIAVQVASGDNSGFILGLENANQVSVRRVDQLNAQVTVKAHVYC